MEHSIAKTKVSVQPLKRLPNGNMVVFISAATFGVLLAIFLFALGITRMMGTNHEQKSSIEAAALAAAKDLSRIVILDNNFGFVGLSDSAPIGQFTIAGDGYCLQVHGINTLLGTIRLDMIIADAINDPIMLQFAKNDYANARLAANNLVSVLQLALGPSTSPGNLTGAATGQMAPSTSQFLDCFGNSVTPYEDAVIAYQSNQVRLAGQSQYVAGTMKLTLGTLRGGAPTNVPIPQPSSYANVSSSQYYNGKYLSYVNTPYDGIDFVFAGVGEDISLIDSNKFLTSDNSLPYAIPTIVKAEADQIFLQGQAIGGRVMHALACAQPASNYDPLPAPGKLSISFPNGAIAAITNPANLLLDPQLNQPPTSLTSPTGGDFPDGTGNLNPVTWQLPGGTGTSGLPPMTVVLKDGLYRWLFRGGTKVNVSAIAAMMTQNFMSSSPNMGEMQNYEFASDGSVLLTMHQRNVVPLRQESQNQLDALSPYTTTDSSGSVTNYRVHISNWIFQPGPTLGGRHAGEPLPDSTLDTTTLSQSHIGSTSTVLSPLRPIYDLTELAQGIEFGAGGLGAGGCDDSNDDKKGKDDDDKTSSSFKNMLWYDSIVSYNPTTGSPTSTPVETYPSGSSKYEGQAPVRPTYQHNGIDVEIEFLQLPPSSPTTSP